MSRHFVALNVGPHIHTWKEIQSFISLSLDNDRGERGVSARYSHEVT